MANLTLKTSDALVVLTLEGDLSRGHARELKTFLQRGLRSMGRLILNCEQVSRMDVVCRRIICSTYHQARKMEKLFIVAGHHPDELQGELAGPALCRGCSMGCGGACLWREN